jgi:curved DNA-binding protein CbpA
MGDNAVAGDPFQALGLPPSAGLRDEDVRSAWRRIAAATHPDREDGGDLERFSVAAAAYEALRTPFGRGEALADLAEVGGGRKRKRPRRRAVGAHRAGKRPADPGYPGGTRRPGYPGDLGGTGYPAGTGYAGNTGQAGNTGYTGNTGQAADGRYLAYPWYPAGTGHSAAPGQPGSGYPVGAGQPPGAQSGSPGFPSTGRGLPVRVAWLAVAAVAAIGAAVVGWTPAAIGLLAGALTAVVWAWWRWSGLDG